MVARSSLSFLSDDGGCRVGLGKRMFRSDTDTDGTDVDRHRGELVKVSCCFLSRNMSSAFNNTLAANKTRALLMIQMHANAMSIEPCSLCLGAARGQGT